MFICSFNCSFVGGALRKGLRQDALQEGLVCLKNGRAEECEEWWSRSCPGSATWQSGSDTGRVLSKRSMKGGIKLVASVRRWLPKSGRKWWVTMMIIHVAWTHAKGPMDPECSKWWWESLQIVWVVPSKCPEGMTQKCRGNPRASTAPSCCFPEGNWLRADWCVLCNSQCVCVDWFKNILTVKWNVNNSKFLFINSNAGVQMVEIQKMRNCYMWHFSVESMPIALNQCWKCWSNTDYYLWDIQISHGFLLFLVTK